MGRATIISGGPDGLYTIACDYSLPGQADELARLLARRTVLQAKIEAAEIKLADLQREVVAAAQSLSQVVEDWQTRVANGEDPDPPIEAEPQPGDMLDTAFVTNAASDCIAAHNTLRSSAGVAALSNHAALSSAAMGHAKWLADNNASGHTGEGGSDPHQRMLAAGFPWGAGARTGENQAAGHNSVAKVMQGWLASADHKTNMLDPEFEEIGVGYAYRSAGLYKHYWVVNFGRQPT